MESLKEFWQVVVEVWRQGVLGVDIGRLLIALGIFLAFLVLRRLFTRVILGRFKSLAARSRTHIDDRVINSLEKPVRLIPLVMGLFFATEYLDLTGLAQVAAGNTIRSLIVVIIFWGLVNMVERTALDLWRQGGGDPSGFHDAVRHTVAGLRTALRQ